MRIRSSLLFAAIAGLVAAAPAGATIVPQDSIGGVALGTSRTAVVSALGPPARTRIVRSEVAPPFREDRFGRLFVLYNSKNRTRGKVIAVTTRSRSERTATGVGVGSTRGEVRRGVEGVRCRNEDGFRHCWVGSFRPGRVVTDFVLGRGGKVRYVNLGRIID
jgi:hypothetical protein